MRASAHNKRFRVPREAVDEGLEGSDGRSLLSGVVGRLNKSQGSLYISMITCHSLIAILSKAVDPFLGSIANAKLDMGTANWAVAPWGTARCPLAYWQSEAEGPAGQKQRKRKAGRARHSAT